MRENLGTFIFLKCSFIGILNRLQPEDYIASILLKVAIEFTEMRIPSKSFTKVSE